MRGESHSPEFGKLRPELKPVNLTKEEFKANTPELTQEELKETLEAFKRDLTGGRMLPVVKGYDFFGKDKPAAWNITDADLAGTGLAKEDLVQVPHGEQNIYHRNFLEAYRKFGSYLGKDFLKGLIAPGWQMAGEDLPARGAEMAMVDGGLKVSYPENFTQARRSERQQKAFGKNISAEATIGDAYLQQEAKNPLYVKFIQLNLTLPNGNLNPDQQRSSELVLTIYLDGSNKADMNQSFQQKPEEQKADSLVRLFRAIKQDPNFIIKLFNEIAPEVFKMSPRHTFIPPAGTAVDYKIKLSIPGMAEKELNLKNWEMPTI